MSKLAFVKLAADVVTGVGVSKIVHDIISNNVTIISNGDRIKVAVGSMVIGSMIAEAASSHVHAKIDKAAEFWQNRKADRKPTAKEILEEVDSKATA